MEISNIQKKDLELQSNKDILMYYHTTIRNVALTSALSFAGLSYSRFYRGKSRIYSAGLVFVSILILLASFIININLYNYMEPQIADYYNEIPHGVKVIDKLNEEFAFKLHETYGMPMDSLKELSEDVNLKLD